MVDCGVVESYEEGRFNYNMFIKVCVLIITCLLLKKKL